VKPDKLTYNMIINAYARSGDVDGTIKWFESMVKAELNPDEVTRPLPSHESVHQDQRLRAPGQPLLKCYQMY
jgi:pentatricopeptide repeat protein